MHMLALALVTLSPELRNPNVITLMPSELDLRIMSQIWIAIQIAPRRSPFVLA